MKPSGFVYLARCGDLVKIGASKHPKSRVCQLSSNLKMKHVLLVAIPAKDHYLLERQLHARFRGQRVRGEYFRLTDSDLLTAAEVRRLIDFFRKYIVLRTSPPERRSRFYKDAMIDDGLYFRVHPDDRPIYLDHLTRDRGYRTRKKRPIVKYIPPSEAMA